jgi:AAA+ ATPase superfamily predicted ATPase
METVMDAIPFNPYIVGNPIKTREMFFGREDDFLYVVRKIGEGKSNQIIVFCGDRRSGKTSILFQILGGRLGERFLPVLVDMQILAGIKDDYHFFRTILKAACGQLNLPDLSIEKLEASAAGTIEALVEVFLKQVESRFPDKILLLLIDEYELIEEKIRDGSLSESSITYLAGILESPRRISLIFTGSTNLEDRKVSYWKSLLGKSIYRKISYLSGNDTRRLITEPLKEYIDYPEQMLESICRLSGGQPFYTQVICQNMVDLLMEEGKNSPALRDLEAVVKDIIDNPLPQMIYSWNSLSEGNKLVLASLAGLLNQPEEWADSSRLLAYLKKNRVQLSFKRERLLVLLEEAYHKEYLEKQENHAYRFRMDFLRRWIKREHSIWKVAREIGLEFRKGLRPLFIGLALLLAAAGAAAALYVLYPDFFKPSAPAAEARAAEAGEAETGKARNVRLSASSGPFRVVIDDSLNLTSSGQADETLIILPEIARGNHHFSFHHAVSEETVELDAAVVKDEQTIAVVLKEPAATPAAAVVVEGSLFIASEPAAARIILDGRDTGLVTPNLLESLNEGKHSLLLELEGYDQASLEFSIAGEETRRETLVLQEAFGVLLFDVRPTARILLDGEPLIETPYLQPVQVRTGRHLLTIINENLGVRKEMTIELARGQTLKIQEVLQ